MKNLCQPDNINIFELDFNIIEKDENNFSIQNYYWFPNTLINSIIENYCLTNKFKTNLEIGPGVVPFTCATHFIGKNEIISNYIEIDLDYQSIPFETNFFDFIYCRHVMEDIQNPDFAFNEIIRISKSGYIETPSPLIEITKGVDGGSYAYKYGGYIHHRYVVWSSIEKNEIYFLPKYGNIIDYFLEIDQVNLDKMTNLINNNPIYWNNYFIWFDIEPKIIMYKNGINFGLNKNMIEDYNKLINEAVNVSIQNTDFFVSNYVNK